MFRLLLDICGSIAFLILIFHGIGKANSQQQDPILNSNITNNLTDNANNSQQHPVLISNAQAAAAMDAHANQLDRFTGHYELITTQDCASDLEVYKPNIIFPNSWPEKVKSVQFTAFVSENDAHLEINWTAEIKNCKGFKIVLKPEGKPEICRILDYTQSILPLSSGQYIFTYKTGRIYEQKYYTLKLFALPILDESSVELKHLNTIDCSMFHPDVNYTYNGKTMKIDFSDGPSVCHYRRYLIAVNRLEGNKKLIELYVPNEEDKKIYSVSFDLDICEGYHYLIIGPDEINSTCACKKKEGVCGGCQLTQTSKDYFIPAESCVPEVYHPKEIKPKQFPLIIPIIVGCIFFIAVIVTLYYYRLSYCSMVVKNGIVLFLDDHDYHTKAVSAVANYLNNCHLNVSLASVFLKNHDVPDPEVLIHELLTSDFILLVLSSALKKRMKAWEQQQDFIEFFKDTNSNIVSKPLLDIILACDRLYVCKFDHTPEFGQWPTKIYSFPTDLRKMVTHLSELEPRHRQTCYNHSQSKNLWKKLKESIEASQHFERTNPSWMEIKYPCPKSVAVSNLMIDDGKSQLDSVGEPEYITIAMMKAMYKDQNGILNSIPEQSISSPPSINTNTISQRLNEINERNNL